MCVFLRLFCATKCGENDDPVGSVCFTIRDRTIYIEQGFYNKVEN